jgi:hypothetical protein
MYPHRLDSIVWGCGKARAGFFSLVLRCGEAILEEVGVVSIEFCSCAPARRSDRTQLAKHRQVKDTSRFQKNFTRSSQRWLAAAIGSIFPTAERADGLELFSRVLNHADSAAGSSKSKYTSRSS